MRFDVVLIFQLNHLIYTHVHPCVMTDDNTPFTNPFCYGTTEFGLARGMPTDNSEHAVECIPIPTLPTARIYNEIIPEICIELVTCKREHKQLQQWVTTLQTSLTDCEARIADCEKRLMAVEKK